MSDITATNLFMFSPSLGKYAAFYQGLLKGVASYQQLGNRLVQLGEQAHVFRQFDKVNEIGQLLSNIPIKDYQAIGYYFLAVAANNKGNGDQEKARKLFEIVSNNAPQQYKAKAILSLAAISAHKSDFDSELRYLMEGLKASPSLAITLSAYRGIAIVKAKEGYHRQALKDLEQIQSLIRYASPLAYFDYLNSLAVELGKAGRKDEARNISKLVLASPFIYAYPEWQETANDLKPANRSFVAFNTTPYLSRTVLLMPVVEHSDSAIIPDKPARVFNLEKWKKKMAKRKKNGDKKKSYEEMDERDMFFEIMQLYTSEEATDEQRRRIFDSVVSIMSEPDTPEPDEPMPDDPKGA
jgi:tetratricopeptide (TPR) repeat protein